MLFDSPIYLIFLALVVCVYWRIGWRHQNALLLAASYFFYAWWDWRFLSLILCSTLVDFLCARAIAASSNAGRRRLLLILSLTLNLGFLGVFKYLNFFVSSLHDALATLGVNAPRQVLSVILPPGISFYTFQAIAYIVDVYNRRMPPARNLLDYALFIAFFPHLIAGPIQRPNHLLPQTQSPRRFDGEVFFSGLQLICYGLLRKCVVADGCSLLADAAFNGTLGPPSIAVLLLGTYAFAWQIYGDFSGYSDIARGSAKLFGFHFMVNFRQPYLSGSLQDFWRRWHISLSTWLRDYLYIPLGGGHGGEARTLRNLLSTMLLGGLWHGANWTFVIWGALHGLVLSVERLARDTFGVFGDSNQPDCRSPRLRLRKVLAMIVTFHIVCLGWVFFRAPTVNAATLMLGGALHWSWRPEYFTALVYLFFFTAPLLLIDLRLEVSQEEYPFETSRWQKRGLAAVAIAAFTLLFAANKANAFIYFQF
jgi:D-alanyl-lipoteichoic acid acyltransferase DltB (MBOAT superfamily)